MRTFNILIEIDERAKFRAAGKEENKITINENVCFCLTVCGENMCKRNNFKCSLQLYKFRNNPCTHYTLRTHYFVEHTIAFPRSCKKIPKKNDGKKMVEKKNDHSTFHYRISTPLFYSSFILDALCY